MEFILPAINWNKFPSSRRGEIRINLFHSPLKINNILLSSQNKMLQKHSYNFKEIFNWHRQSVPLHWLL